MSNIYSLGDQVELQRIRIQADVYFLEIATGAVIRNSLGSLEIAGKGSYQLLCWIFQAFDGSRTYADAAAKLSAAMESHVRAIVLRLLERRFARILAPDEPHDNPLRERYPELYNLLEYRNSPVLEAWQRVLQIKVAVFGDGQLKQAVVDALPEYGFQLDTEASALHCVGLVVSDTIAGYRHAFEMTGVEADQIAGGLCRHGGILYGLVKHDQPSLAGPASLDELVTEADPDTEKLFLGHAAKAIAAHALCLGLFEYFSQNAGQRPEPRLLVIDESMLELSHHRLAPSVLLGSKPFDCLTHPISITNAEGSLRPDLGGSILPDSQTQILNSIARSISELTDTRTGPLLSINDGDLFQLPLAAAIAKHTSRDKGAPQQILTLGLSARETHNQGVLAAIEGCLALSESGLTRGAGWSPREALLRAGRALFERDSSSYDTGVELHFRWEQAPKSLIYLVELFDDVVHTMRCVRNRYGWYMAHHSDLDTIEGRGALFGIGILPELAIGDLLLKIAAMRCYREARFDSTSSVLLSMELEEVVIANALLTGMTELEAKAMTSPWTLARTDACQLCLIELRIR
jgi:hypothetical protein